MRSNFLRAVLSNPKMDLLEDDGDGSERSGKRQYSLYVGAAPEHGAQVILRLRALLLSEPRWSQFWRKIEQFGVPKIASY